MEVLDEKQGQRYQGFRVSLNYQWSESASQSEDEWNYVHTFRPQIDLTWSTNPTLQQQIRIGTHASLTKQKRGGTEPREYRPIVAYAEHLWNVTDRTLWTNRVDYSSSFDLSNDREGHFVELSSQYELFIEDKLSLLGEISGKFTNLTVDDEVNQTWSMTYRLGLQYDLDRTFFN